MKARRDFHFVHAPNLEIIDTSFIGLGLWTTRPYDVMHVVPGSAYSVQRAGGSIKRTIELYSTCLNECTLWPIPNTFSRCGERLACPRMDFHMSEFNFAQPVDLVGSARLTRSAFSHRMTDWDR